MSAYHPVRTTATPSLEHTAYTISEAISYFVKTLTKPNNYPRIVRRYLEFCIRENYLIDPISFQHYTAGQRASLVSPVRKFLRFAQAHNIRQIMADPEKKTVPPAANELILGFIRDAAHLRGDHSKDTYIRVMNVFFAFMEKQQASFSPATVNDFVSDLLKRHKSPFTVNLYLSVVKQLAAWIIKARQRIGYDFDAEQLESLRDISYIRWVPTEDGFYKDSLSQEERSILQQSLPDARWKAVAALMSYCGLRSVEVTRLRIKDVRLEEKQLLVKGKGKHTYVPVKIFAPCMIFLQAWMQERMQMVGAGVQPSAALFPELKTSQIQYRIKKAMKESGLAREKLSTHSLRHTAGQILIDKQVEAVYVQRQLRHKKFDTTYNYVRKQMDKDFMDRLPDEV